MFLFKLVYEKRKDFKIMASYLLQNIEPLREIILPVNTYETKEDKQSSFSGIKEGIKYVNNNHCLGMFPAGESSTHFEVSKIILDNEWQTPALKFIKRAERTCSTGLFSRYKFKTFAYFQKDKSSYETHAPAG